MGIVQVIIDRTTSMIIEGTYEFDRTDGGTLVAPSGSAFPSTPAAKEWFWRSDESKLYRRNDTNTVWDAVVSAIAAHRTTHEPGGTDALTVDAAAATGSLRTLGTGALQACAGNDARLSDARTPVAHKTSHEPGGSDALTVDAAAITGSLRTIGTGALQACAGNDGRLSDARPPTAHKTSHEPGGTDALTVDAAAATGSLRTLGTGALQACAGNDARLSDARTPTAHASTHNAGGSDAMAIDAVAGTGSLRTLGTSATSACAGNDSRLSDSRTPTAHATSHKSGGSDAIKLDELAAPTDITTLNVSTSAHGLQPKLPNDASKYMDGTGNYSVPAGSGSIFGSNYQTAISTARSTTTSATMQDKTTLTTGALTGTYRVGWCSVIDAATASNKLVEAQLYNVTDAAVVGAVQIQRPSAATPRHFAGGFAEVVFTGAAKTFKIQYRSPDGSTTVGIQDARIELWRVS